ncbi:SIMPL domain-containing protein [Photobacterium sp. 1_MG-2023]|uniref:SIMPL domain-containing protein n=1 Tax=Photobacterium sp. 1_MG-2023 TaxID=3062646 RepID=UPI0026E42E80|nr:SIMPL domain-containing protein [Photobacterium sp. 1_MG-2023]MDO6708581.1 SIMPL domain-containing protein [Photobacterium sp. 1_MG-2023]
MQKQQDKIGFALLGVFIFLGLACLGYLLGHAALAYKQFDRSVTVKGLSEREFPADIVIWPIQFNVASNDLGELYQMLDGQTSQIRAYLRSNGIGANEISVSTPAITDKSAQQYGNEAQVAYRYTAFQTVTVYSSEIENVRAVMGTLSELGKQGIVFTGDAYQTQTEYLFTRLNEIKPGMIEEATTNAREVAQKFASDSDSTLGKIRKASQGQFSISARDKNNPHIKKIRVVSTVEYYLSD